MDLSGSTMVMPSSVVSFKPEKAAKKMDKKKRDF